MKENIINAIFSFFGGLVGFLFGEINEIFYILIALIVIDFITGLIKAGFQKKLNSEVCFKGIIKKVFILVIVSLGHLLDMAIGQSICGNVVMFFYIANESISIIENAGIIGLPIPKKIKDILEQLKEKEDADESE